MLRFILVTLLCGLLVAQQASPPVQPPAPQQAQAPEIAPETTIKVGVEEVSTPALVFDRDGNYVNGLTAQDFRLFDNGKQQNIEVDVTFVPISLVICIQANASATGLLPHVAKIGNLINPLLIGDQGEAAVIAYDHRIRILQEFTSDPEKITAAVKSIKPGSSSNRLIDAANDATRLLRSRPKNRRRLIMQIGETRDISSEARARETLINMQLGNIVFYGVDMSRFMTTLTTPPPVPRPDNNPPAIRGTLPMGQPSTPTTIAQMTGGNSGRAEFVPLMVEVFRDVKAVFKSNPVEVFTKGTGGSEFGFRSYRTLEEAIQRMGEELHSGYLITYSPNNKEEGGFHEIVVDVPERRDVKRVQTRPGYWLGPK
jgi:VWFA-related protein